MANAKFWCDAIFTSKVMRNDLSVYKIAQIKIAEVNLNKDALLPVDQMAFNSISIFNQIYSPWSSKQLPRLDYMTGYQDSSSRNGHQVTCLIEIPICLCDDDNVDLIHWHIYAALGG